MESRSESDEYPTYSPTSESRLESFAHLKRAVERVGPHNYRVTGLNNLVTKFMVTGCHGTGKSTQKYVAALMEKVAGISPETKPDFIIFLGDNGYDYGFNSPAHPGFGSCFHDVYGNPQLPIISRTVCLEILGNHDENYHAKYKMSSNPQGWSTGINQSAHTYLDHTETKVNLFSQDIIDFRDLQGYAECGEQWIMPYAFFTFDFGAISLFCLNTNSYAKDFLDLKLGRVDKTRVNQAEWLQKEYDLAVKAGKKIIFCAHHPLYTSGKRANPAKFDATHYLTESEIKSLQALLKIGSTSYQVILTSIFVSQGMDKLFYYFAAHDHGMSVFDNTDKKDPPIKLRQFISGGGGGSLDERTTCDEHPYVFHLKKHGIGLFTYDVTQPDGYQLDLFALEKPGSEDYLHIKFNEKGKHLPILKEQSDSRVELLVASVLLTCNAYLSKIRESEFEDKGTDYGLGWTALFKWSASQAKEYLRPDQHFKLRKEKILAVDNIRSYFNQFNLPHFDKLIEKLYELIKEINHIDQQQFFNSLNTEIKEIMQTTLDDLFRPLVEREQAHDRERLPFSFKKSLLK